MLHDDILYEDDNQFIPMTIRPGTVVLATGDQKGRCQVVETTNSWYVKNGRQNACDHPLRHFKKDESIEEKCSISGEEKNLLLVLKKSYSGWYPVLNTFTHVEIYRQWCLCNFRHCLWAA